MDVDREQERVPKVRGDDAETWIPCPLDRKNGRGIEAQAS